MENETDGTMENQENKKGEEKSDTRPVDQVPGDMVRDDDRGQRENFEKNSSDDTDEQKPLNKDQIDSEPTPFDKSAQPSKDDSESGSFMELYEKSLRSIQEGELVSGEIVMIGKEHVLVDIGYKSEGQIRISEFIDHKGNLTAKIGDRVDVLLERREDEDGRIILSKEKAAKIKIWDEIKEIYERDGNIRGKIVSRLKGGMAVDIGLQAFLPGSQIDLKPIRNFDALIGTEHNFKILK